MARGWLATRSSWLYWVIVPGTVASYWLLREMIVGLEEQGIIASNLTINIVLMIGIWSYFCQDLTNAVYRKVRGKDKTAPVWLSWVVLVFIVLGLVYYLTLWGFETRW